MVPSARHLYRNKLNSMELKNLEQYSILYSTVHETLKSDLIVRHTLHLAEFNPKLSIETKMREPARAAGRGPREQWTALPPAAAGEVSTFIKLYPHRHQCIVLVLIECICTVIKRHKTRREIKRTCSSFSNLISNVSACVLCTVQCTLHSTALSFFLQWIMGYRNKVLH